LNVSRIGELHSRSLNNTDEALAQQNAAALDELVEETRALSNQIKNQIRDLEKESVPPGQDPRIRKNQACQTPGKWVHAFA
jgi:syntaxin 1B/2/3